MRPYNLRTSSGGRVHSALTTNLSGDIDEAAAIKKRKMSNMFIECSNSLNILLVNLSLLCATSLGLLLFLLSDLGTLRLNLTGTSQRTVNFTLFGF
jgi:hypothetical protein